jgi:hypothetical protein
MMSLSEKFTAATARRLRAKARLSGSGAAGKLTEIRRPRHAQDTDFLSVKLTLTTIS